ncbi:MAG TPA: hypothetical protein VF503_09145 [Sphingobium sp.]|uniref:hypothetical protein n=1 Tax=Sphingobium sp. TaxID=1912891 RepID=UPI002ED2CBF5
MVDQQANSSREALVVQSTLGNNTAYTVIEWNSIRPASRDRSSDISRPLSLPTSSRPR